MVRPVENYPTESETRWKERSLFWTRLAIMTVCGVLAMPKHAFSEPVRAESSDPFAAMSVDELPTGLKVVLDPRFRHYEVRVELRILLPNRSSDSKQVALAALAKQFLLRDEWGVSRREVFDGANGTLEAQNNPRYLSFSSSLPSVKGTWVVNELAKILNPRLVDTESLNRAKTEVIQELGLHVIRPTNWLRQMVLPFGEPSFYKSEFSIDEPVFDRESVRRHLSEISVAQLKSYLDTLCTTNNSILFLSGPFKRIETLGFINETYAHVNQDREASARSIPAPVLRNAPFVRSRRAAELPRIVIGTKLWDLEPQDEMVLRAYFKHLSNWTQAQGLAVDSDVDLSLQIERARFGVASIGFNVSFERYGSALDAIRSALESAAQDDSLPDDTIVRIVEDYLIKLSADPLSSSEGFFGFRSRYRIEATPSEIIAAISRDEFRARLKKILRPNMRYLRTWEPPLLLEDEQWMIFLLAVGLTLYGLKRALRSNFEHAKIRYVRKIRFSLMTQGVFVVCFVAILAAFAQAAALIDQLLFSSSWFQATFVLNTYLKGATLSALGVSLCVGYLCLIPRKIMVCGNMIVFKSLSYASHRYPIELLRDITICRPWHVMQFARNVGRLRWMNGSFWAKGLLMRFSDRTSYYVCFNNPEKVAYELQDVLMAAESADRPQQIAS